MTKEIKLLSDEFIAGIEPEAKRLIKWIEKNPSPESGYIELIVTLMMLGNLTYHEAIGIMEDAKYVFRRNFR